MESINGASEVHVRGKANIVPVGNVNRLPHPDKPFQGKIGPTTDVSTPDFPEQVKAPEGAPNIVLIMTDDVGYGAASTWGGPIHTPNMTKLAKSGGIKYNRFHTTAMCSPTRASLLTGRYPHNVGTGIVKDNSLGYPGYNSIIPKSCANIGLVLNMNGYGTGWFGKNHNIPDWETGNVGPFDSWPTSIGFEKFYGFIGGDTNQWQPTVYDNTTPVEPAIGKPDYHFDADLADNAIKWYTEQKTLKPERPVFMFYCPGATHAPHHVAPEWIEKYKDQFTEGWDELRKKTFERQIKEGIIPPDTKLTPRPDNIEAWSELSEDRKEVYVKFMQCYAGFLEYCDHNIGRVIDAVEALPGGENTLFIYIQGDNGGSAEGTTQGTLNEYAVMGNDIEEPWEYIKEHADEIGTKKHFNLFPVGWGWAMNSPMQWAKRFASHFGGTRNGMVMKWPKHMKDKETVRTQFHHVCDIAPTIYDAAKITHPVHVVNGIEQKPLDGISMEYTWADATAADARTRMIFEMQGNRGMYENGWMACTTPQSFAWIKKDKSAPPPTTSSFEWELYNLDNDYSQGDNVAGDPKNAQTLKKLKALWWDEAAKTQILPLTYDSSAAIAESAPLRPSATEGQTEFEYSTRMTRITEGVAPQLKNCSYEIIADIVLHESNEEGVIITQGGRFAGWGIIMFESKPTFVYRTSQMEDEDHLLKLEWHSPLLPGRYRIKIEFDYDGDNQDMEKGEVEVGAGGTFSMSVTSLGGKNCHVQDLHEQEPVQGYIRETIVLCFSNNETMDIGCDTGTPVLEEYDSRMPFNFTGEISKIKINIQPRKLSEEALYHLRQLIAQFAAALD